MFLSKFDTTKVLNAFSIPICIMSSTQKRDSASKNTFAKTASGIRGLDEITFGGLPKGRPTLIAGGAGSGKTLMSMEFLVRGAT